jgi:hypothetical protein
MSVKKAAIAMYYRLIGKQGRAAEEKAKEAARNRLADRASEQAREAVRAFERERDAVAATARRTISLIARANERLS